MDTGNWLTIIAAIGSAGVTYGVMANKLGNALTELKEFKAEVNRSRERTGERLEEVGKQLTRLEERVKVRRLTSPGIHPEKK